MRPASFAVRIMEAVVAIRSTRPGPASLPEEEKRISVPFSLSNKEYPRLQKLRAAFEVREGHPPTNEELQLLAKNLAFAAIDAYCEASLHEEELLIL